MINNGDISKTLDGTTISYTIPKGYHGGLGTVKITLEQKTVTPSEEEQTITASPGKVMNEVIVSAIPSNYKDTSIATVVPDKILADEIAFGTEGKVVGTMPNNGAISQVLDTTTNSFTIPKGYHDGTGTISLVTETKEVTPTKSIQTITPTKGKVLSSVSVQAIPVDFISTTDATATLDKILEGETAYVKGEKITGTMKNNADVSATLDGLTTSSITIPTGFTSGGTISLTNDIEEALKAI